MVKWGTKTYPWMRLLQLVPAGMLCGTEVQGWIGNAGTPVPIFVPRLGLMKPGQT